MVPTAMYAAEWPILKTRAVVSSSLLAGFPSLFEDGQMYLAQRESTSTMGKVKSETGYFHDAKKCIAN